VVELSERNAKFFRQEQFKTIKIVSRPSCELIDGVNESGLGG
jgi:hypothetical protein